MKVVVADDAALIREALAEVLTRAGHDVIAVEDAASLHKEVALHAPAAAVIDVRMPPDHSTEGIEAALRIRRDHPGVGVLLLSQGVARAGLDALIPPGTSVAGVGYLLKERVSGIAAFLEALERVARGGTAIDPEVVHLLLGEHRSEAAFSGLSPREAEVLALMAEGLSNRAICSRLDVSAKTIEARVTSIFLKLGLRSETDENRRVMAVLAYLQSQA